MPKKNPLRIPTSSQILRAIGLKPRPKKRSPKWPRGHPKRHSRASKKAWARKRRLLAYQKKKRGAHAVKVDRRKQARQVFPISDKKGVKKWKKAPQKYDIRGVDTAKYRLKLLVKRVAPVYQKGNARVKRRILHAKAKERAIRQSKLPRAEKKKRVQRVRAKAKQDIKEISSQTKREAQLRAESVRTVPSRPQAKRWSTERKKQAGAVASQTGTSVVQADKLIQRARSKGWEYDTVNWDTMQGRDLSYSDRIERLERQVGKTTTRSEEDRWIRSEMERFEDQHQRYVQEEQRRAGYGTPG